MTNARALVVRFNDGNNAAVVAITDDDTFGVAGQLFAVQGVASITLEDAETAALIAVGVAKGMTAAEAELAALEADVFGTVIDPGTPVADWGKRAS